MGKIKVAWLCAFANDEIAQLIGVQSQSTVSPWISDLINLFRLKNDIELYIISPNYYNNRHKYILVDNIHIFLFKYMPNYLPKKFYNLSYNYNITCRSVKEILAMLKPNLIHLFGSENPLYSAGILYFQNKIPILVSIQGFVHLSSPPANLISKYIRWNRIRIERKINSNEKYFGCATEDVKKVLNEINPSSVKFDTFYPTTIPEVCAHNYPQKKYDLVYFARISKDKGIEDFIEAVAQLKKTIQNIKTIVIGGGNDNYIQILKEYIKRKNLDTNILFAGFQASQQDVFKLAARSQVYVLPTHFDGIPGTIREAMYMKLPVVAYNVGGIPSLNEQIECITLAEKNNIQDLVEKINLVINETDRTERLVNNAFNLIKNKFDNNKIYADLISIYNSILKMN